MYNQDIFIDNTGTHLKNREDQEGWSFLTTTAGK